MKTLLKILLRDAMRSGAVSGAGRLDAATFKSIEVWIREKQYLDSEDTMRDVAGKLGISVGQLAGYCRRVVGKPFLSWRKELRIREACRLIEEEPDTPLYIIGELVGIKDKSNFRRQFTEVMKTSPAAWRRDREKRQG